jgi:rod shape-determining protein MreC
MVARRTQREIRQRAPLWLILLLSASFFLMAYDAHENGDSTKQRVVRLWAEAAVSPFQRLSSGAGGMGKGVFDRIANLRTADAQNGELKRRVDELEEEVEKTRPAVAEAARLRSLLDLKEESKYPTLAARVIARDPSLWFNTVIIDRGSASGVENNMPVVTRGGIVGRIIATSPVTAQVMLITDEKSGAGAVVGKLGASNALGSIKGLGENGLVEMRYVSGLETVENDDDVMTTGQDGIYPPNFEVGKVVSVKHGSATVAHVIYIKPGARIDQLEEVAVLLYHPPQRAAPDQVLPNADDKGKKKH